ncbi:MAG TPA: hypothetical protein VGO07_02990 [Candidatus Saccharimonadales bacterium]|jgi:hypothetical protein|nr:hypothetical protein [Candidatus Saccharimonadales bacterium]
MGRHFAETAGDQPELSPAARILEGHGLGHLLDVQIVNYHGGDLTTVADALACGPFADAIGAMDTALSAEQFVPTMEAYIAGMAPPAEGAA